MCAQKLDRLTLILFKLYLHDIKLVQRNFIVHCATRSSKQAYKTRQKEDTG